MGKATHSKGTDVRAESRFASFRARRRFASLDGVRCLCILAVIWHHTPGSHGLGIDLLKRGFLGVDMFFVLSGFLITTLLIREREDHGRISLRAFWIRRSLRIFPIYYITLLAVVAAHLLLRRGDPATQQLLGDLPYHVFYVSNWKHDIGANLGPLWSLATEEQFYLVWPLVEVFAVLWARRAVLVLLLVVNALIATRIGVTAMFEGGADHPIFDLEIMQTTFLPILFGVTLAHLLHSPRWYAPIARATAHPFAPVVWGLALIALMAGVPGNIQGWPRIAMQLCMTGFVASTVTQDRQVLSGFLGLVVVRRIGEISYAMYLFHMWGIDIVRRITQKLGVDPGPIVLFVAVSCGVALAAEVSFRLIEAPILRFKKRFARVDMSRDAGHAGVA